MELDKYQQAWRAEAARTRVTVDAAALSREVQGAQRTFQSVILWRDIREIVVSLLMLVVWVFLGNQLSLPWSWYLTMPALLWVVGFIVLDRRRHPQRLSDPGQPLLYYVRESLRQVEHQIWLLRNVFWWYLLPLTVSIVAFFVHVSWRASNGWLGFISVAGCSCGFLLATYWWIYRLNQRVVRDQLEPRRQDLLRLIEYLDSESNGKDTDDLADLVAALNDPAAQHGLNTSWAQNWNRLIPTWRVANLIHLATAIGALGGLVIREWWVSDRTMPELFLPVVGGVIAFELAFALAWWQSRRPVRQRAEVGQPVQCVAEQVIAENKVLQEPKAWPRAPALCILALLMFVSFMACLVLYQFVSLSAVTRQPGLNDMGAVGSDDPARIDLWLQRFVEGSVNYPSLSAAIARDGQIVYCGAVGYADMEAGLKATPQTQYHVASVTKAFTATLALILHEHGVIDLDQPVVTYLPQSVSISTTPEVGATITLRQLASHTSGLPRGIAGRVQSVEGWYQLEPHRLYAQLAKMKMESTPGTAAVYSNLGFGLLGHALELAANKPLDQLMNEYLCDPLQLSQTSIPVDGTLRPATGYDGRTRLVARHSHQERLAGSGGLVTSVEDLATFLMAQMTPGYLSEGMLRQLQAETKLADGTGSGNSLGWSVGSHASVGRILTKNGGRNNCSAWIGFAPEHRVAVAIVTNCGGPAVDPLGVELLRQFATSASGTPIPE